MVTANAASMLGLEKELGSLAPGMAADVSVLGLDKGKWTLADSLGNHIVGTQRLRPEFALRAGAVMQADSPLLFESTAKAA
jgi:predicted amidohydrolase